MIDLNEWDDQPVSEEDSKKSIFGEKLNEVRNLRMPSPSATVNEWNGNRTVTPRRKTVDDMQAELRAVEEDSAWKQKVADSQKAFYGEDGPTFREKFGIPLAIRGRNLVQGAKENYYEQMAGAGPQNFSDIFAKPDNLIGAPFEMVSRIPIYLKNKALDFAPDSFKQARADDLLDFKKGKVQQLYDDSLYSPTNSPDFSTRAVGYLGTAAPELLSMALTKRLAGMPEANSFLKKDLFNGFFGSGKVASEAKAGEYASKMLQNVLGDVGSGYIQGGLDQTQTATQGAEDAAITGALTRFLGKAAVREPNFESSEFRSKIKAIKEIEDKTGKKLFVTSGDLTRNPFDQRFEAQLADSDTAGPFMRRKMSENEGIVAQYMKDHILPNGPAVPDSDAFPAFDEGWMNALLGKAKAGLEAPPAGQISLRTIPDDLRSSISSTNASNSPHVKKILNRYENDFMDNMNQDLTANLTPEVYKSRLSEINDLLTKKGAGGKGNYLKDEERNALELIQREYHDAAAAVDPNYLENLRQANYEYAMQGTAIPMVTDPMTRRLSFAKTTHPDFQMTQPATRADGSIIQKLDGSPESLSDIVKDASYVIGPENKASLSLGDRSHDIFNPGNIFTALMTKAPSIGTAAVTRVGNLFGKEVGERILDMALRDRPWIGGSPTQVLSQGGYTRSGFQAAKEIGKKVAADAAYDQYKQLEEQKKKNPFIYPM